MKKTIYNYLDDAELALKESKDMVNNKERVEDILKKSLTLNPISIKEIAILLETEDPSLIDHILKASSELKNKVFGNAVVLFAPLYLSNYCINDCVYCGFRKSNELLPRKALNEEEIIREAKYLSSKGFKRVLVVLGEDPKEYGADYIAKAIKIIKDNTDIDTVQVNAPPMDVEDLKIIQQAGGELFQVFQETYHIPTYKVMHPSGIKKDFHYRVEVMDRCLESGFSSLGLGVLLGLYDYKSDVLKCIAHARHITEISKTVNIGFSIPRLKEALGSTLHEAPEPVSDLELKKIIAIYRLSMPYSNVTVSTREEPAFRQSLLDAGANVLSAASVTEPGGYTNTDDSKKTLAQFKTFDKRDISDIMETLIKEGFLPSLVSVSNGNGKTRDMLSANALLSLKEYSEKFNKIKETLDAEIENSKDKIEDKSIKEDFLKRFAEIENKGKAKFF